MHNEKVAAGEQRFVPSGVDAQSWIGFEARIQERRYRALLNTINIAIANGDGLSARLALDEARELRPDAADLAALASRVALLPVAVPAGELSATLWSRAAGAVGLLLVGVAFLIGIEWLHPASVPPSMVQPPVSVPAQQPADAPGLRVAAPVATVAPSATLVEAVAPAPAPAPAAPSVAPGPQPVGTVGVTRVATLEESGSAIAPRPSFQSPPSFQPTTVRGPAVPSDGEIPDDYVAAPPRREGGVIIPAPQIAASPAPASAPYANVLRQPTSVVNPPTPAPAAASSAAVVAPPRADENRVAQVLNQYARAYGELDAGAAHAVWPSVDQRALARAFSSLQSQTVAFDNCDISVSGTTANASCRGRASYVAKVGSREPRSEARTWNFALRRDGEAWTIENAEARRVAENEQR